MQDDLILLRRIRALDEDALTTVHDTYYAAIFRYISYRVSDYHVAEDLTSDVFTRLLSALRDHTAPSNSLRGWMFTVASRVVKDFYRKQYRTREAPLDDSLPSLKAEPDQAVMDLLDQEKLYEAMKTLTEDQQHVVALRFGYGMPIREVAEVMGKSEGSVKMLQARAISALSDELGHGEGA